MEKSKRPWLAPIIILLLLVFQQFASKIGGLIANSFSYDRIDEYNIFVWISVHHIMQMLLALAAIGILAKAKKLDFGFGFGNVKAGLKHTLIFTIVVLIYALVSSVISYHFGLTPTLDYPLNIQNVAGVLGFQLLLSGTSEEILFRALPITLLAYSFKASRCVKIYKLEIPAETLIAAVLFTVAHVSWRVYPFSANADLVQLTISFVFGIFYGVAYQKSKSVIYPMAMHGISNFLIVGFWYSFEIAYR